MCARNKSIYLQKCRRVPLGAHVSNRFQRCRGERCLRLLVPASYVRMWSRCCNKVSKWASKEVARFVRCNGEPPLLASADVLSLSYSSTLDLSPRQPRVSRSPRRPPPRRPSVFSKEVGKTTQIPVEPHGVPVSNVGLVPFWITYLIYLSRRNLRSQEIDQTALPLEVNMYDTR